MPDSDWPQCWGAVGQCPLSLGGNGHKLKAGGSVSTEKHFFTVRMTDTGYPGRLWSPWRCSEAIWDKVWAICSQWPCFSREVGQDNPQRSLPTSAIVWFCEDDEQLCLLPILCPFRDWQSNHLWATQREEANRTSTFLVGCQAKPQPFWISALGSFKPRAKAGQATSHLHSVAYGVLAWQDVLGRTRTHIKETLIRAVVEGQIANRWELFALYLLNCGFGLVWRGLNNINFHTSGRQYLCHPKYLCQKSSVLTLWLQGCFSLCYSLNQVSNY